jgi:hypothetical protein
VNRRRVEVAETLIRDQHLNLRTLNIIRACGERFALLDE